MRRGCLVEFQARIQPRTVQLRKEETARVWIASISLQFLKHTLKKKTKTSYSLNNPFICPIHLFTPRLLSAHVEQEKVLVPETKRIVYTQRKDFPSSPVLKVGVGFTSPTLHVGLFNLIKSKRKRILPEERPSP